MTSATTTQLGALRVEDAMHEGVFTCERETPLAEVARTMVRERVHCVVVESGSGESGPLWGVVSNLDLVAAAMVRGLEEQTAGGSAASPVVLVRRGDTLGRAAQLMTEHGTAHLVVADPGTGQPVGVLSTLDIAAALTAES